MSYLAKHLNHHLVRFCLKKVKVAQYTLKTLLNSAKYFLIIKDRMMQRSTQVKLVEKNMQICLRKRDES